MSWAWPSTVPACFVFSNNEQSMEQILNEVKQSSSLSLSWAWPCCCHTRLHLGYSAKLRIWQVSACKMEPQSGTIITLELASHPASQPAVYLLWLSQCCAVSPPQLFPPSMKYVRCPPSQYMFFLTPIVPPFRKYGRCPPLPVYAVSVRCPPPQCNVVPLPYSALPWILSKTDLETAIGHRNYYARATTWLNTKMISSP